MRALLKLLLYFFWIGTYPLQAQDHFAINDYYPIADQNTWRYEAPEGWKDGDYISKIEADTTAFQSLFEGIENVDIPEGWNDLKHAEGFFHYDAVKSAKLLKITDQGIFYVGEFFGNDGSFVLFNSPILWFNDKESIGSKLDEKRSFTRYYEDGKRSQGSFQITQRIKEKEDVTTPKDVFSDCLHVEFDTHWDFGKGSEAKSINAYHYAKDVGVVKASARFILLMKGKELVNRLVEPQIKSYELH